MKKTKLKIFTAIIIYITALILTKIEVNIWIPRALFIISYLITGIEVLIEAIEGICKGEMLDENFLMSVATIGAFIMGDYPEAASVMILFQIGEAFQDYAVDKSRKSISSLMEMRPDYANVEVNGNIEKVDPNMVKINDVIVINPGEKVPVDGKVLEGTTLLDTKALTGEYIPRKVEKGDEVLSGCINQEGLIRLKVTKNFEESTVNKILKLVEDVNENKSKSENFITKFARFYTPIVVILALILAFVPPFLLHISEFSKWAYRALSFLVVSCPCALVISIPLSFFGAIGGASKKGILIKGSNYIESLANSEIAVFDKTGTLTKGEFKVQKICPKEISQEELLEYVAYAENHSSHPIAKSIREAYGKNIDLSKISDIKEISGHGICAIIQGKEVIAGNEKLMKEKQIEYTAVTEIGTTIYIAIDNKYAGYILISDTIKDDASRAIENLKGIGIKKTVMLTGDKKDVSEAVARTLNINETYTELLPNDKVERLKELLKYRRNKGTLFFAGDGMNDSPVLALADVGIAMGGLGSDSAIEVSDVVIMEDEPSKIVEAIKLAKKNMRIVKENIIFAILVKITVLILSALGFSNMWFAIFADVGVSILAILNSLRMLK